MPDIATLIRYAEVCARLAGIRRKAHPDWDEALERTLKDLEALRDSWDLWKFAALILGTLAAA